MSTSSVPETVPFAALENAVPVRVAAVRIFERIAYGGDMLDRALAQDPEFSAFNHLDRALIRMMVTTTIRRLGQIDAIIKSAMNDKVPEPRLLLSVLRLSAAQILFMNVPDHAAVKLGVDLAVAMGLERARGLTNAVLRRVAREGGPITTRQDIPRLNIPQWMMDDWIAAYGARAALEAGQASLMEAPLDISLRDPSDAAHWAKMLGAEVLPTGTLRLCDLRGAIDSLPGYADGAWWVQDASAALPVHIMGDVAGKTVIDLCAAPGGKTAQLASAGARVIAIDRHDGRMDILRENMARLNLGSKVEVVIADGATYVPSEGADIVLIDAPCTATGTLRRNPDIMLHRDIKDIGRMSAVQESLINHARALLKPGGLLVYAVCSLQPDEGEKQIERFLKRSPDFERVAITPAQVSGLDILTPAGEIRVLPTQLADKGGMDGFFTSTLRFKG